MKIKLNGEPRDLNSAVRLSELIRHELNGKEAKGVAVAVNTKVVPKQSWETIILNENDSVEIVNAVQGG